MKTIILKLTKEEYSLIENSEFVWSRFAYDIDLNVEDVDKFREFLDDRINELKNIYSDLSNKGISEYLRLYLQEYNQVQIVPVRCKKDRLLPSFPKTIPPIRLKEPSGRGGVVLSRSYLPCPEILSWQQPLPPCVQLSSGKNRDSLQTKNRQMQYRDLISCSSAAFFYGRVCRFYCICVNR